jgi:hypothetical protein
MVKPGRISTTLLCTTLLSTLKDLSLQGLIHETTLLAQHCWQPEQAAVVQSCLGALAAEKTAVQTSCCCLLTKKRGPGSVGYMLALTADLTPSAPTTMRALQSRKQHHAPNTSPILTHPQHGGKRRYW